MVETEKYPPDSSEAILRRTDERMLCKSSFSVLRVIWVVMRINGGRKHYQGRNSMKSSKKCSSAFADVGSTALSFAGKTEGFTSVTSSEVNFVKRHNSALKLD